jgi:hypothetical protein
MRYLPHNEIWIHSRPGEIPSRGENIAWENLPDNIVEGSRPIADIHWVGVRHGDDYATRGRRILISLSLPR